MRTIVVCGATGNQGRSVVAALAGRARVRALVRDRAKAQRLLPGVELVDGDLNDRGSLERAFAGAEGVFGVTQPWSADYRRADVAAEIAQGKALIEAARASGARLVLSTVLRRDDRPTGIPHVDSKLEIERLLRAAGTPHVILGPASFMDNIGLSFFPVKKGKVRGFTDGDAKVPLIACRDIGRAAAAAFEQFEAYDGKLVNLIGGLYSGDDICATLSRLRGGERFRWSA